MEESDCVRDSREVGMEVTIPVSPDDVRFDG